VGRTSAAGVVREQDFEVPPDYSKMDTKTAVSTYDHRTDEQLVRFAGRRPAFGKR